MSYLEKSIFHVKLSYTLYMIYHWTCCFNYISNVSLKLCVSEQKNTMALENDNPLGRDPNSLLVAGDSRANVQPMLIAFHTLFVREHNRLCDEYRKIHPQVKLICKAKNHKWMLINRFACLSRGRVIISNLLSSTTFDESLQGPVIYCQTVAIEFCGCRTMSHPTVKTKANKNDNNLIQWFLFMMNANGNIRYKRNSHSFKQKKKYWRYLIGFSLYSLSLFCTIASPVTLFIKRAKR